VLPDQFARDDQAFLARFKRGSQAAASLSHRNIVSLYDLSIGGTYPHFVVMEYVEGRTLRDVIRDKGPLRPKRATEIAADVCDALAVAHDKGLIHGGLKPSNLMLTPDGTVKVMDFVIAGMTPSEEALSRVQLAFEPAVYISPEEGKGSQPTAVATCTPSVAAYTKC
jgi:eukaryotic-like serine/threonine-protein kinase